MTEILAVHFQGEGMEDVTLVWMVTDADNDILYFGALSFAKP